MVRINRINAVLMIEAGLCSSPLLVGAASAQEVHFTPNQIMNWPTRSFDGETQYAVVEKSGRRVLASKPHLPGAGRKH
ncbi:hypothetical protein ACE3G8_16775 [Vreelandella venusta]